MSSGYTVADLPRFAAVWLAVSVVVGPLPWCGGRRLGTAAADVRPYRRRGAAGRAPLAAEAILRLIQVEAWTGLDLARTDIQVGLIELAAAGVLPAVLAPAGERSARLPGRGDRHRGRNAS